MTSYSVARVSDLEPGCLKRVEAEGTVICLARLEDGTFRAVPDACTHEEVSLSDGEIDGNELECPAHGSRFDLDTGEVSGLPALIPTKPYKVAVDGDDVLIEI